MLQNNAKHTFRMFSSQLFVDMLTKLIRFDKTVLYNKLESYQSSMHSLHTLNKFYVQFLTKIRGVFLGLPSHLSLQSGGWERRLRRPARTSCICTGPAKSWRAWACRKCFPLAVMKEDMVGDFSQAILMMKGKTTKNWRISIQGNLDNTRIWWSSHPLGNSVAKHWFTASTGAVEPYWHDDISIGSWLEACGLPFVVDNRRRLYGTESPSLTSSSWSNSGIIKHIPTWIRTTARMGERKVANASDSLETWRLRMGTLGTTSACQKSLKRSPRSHRCLRCQGPWNPMRPWSKNLNDEVNQSLSNTHAALFTLWY